MFGGGRIDGHAADRVFYRLGMCPVGRPGAPIGTVTGGMVVVVPCVLIVLRHFHLSLKQLA